MNVHEILFELTKRISVRRGKTQRSPLALRSVFPADGISQQLSLPSAPFSAKAQVCANVGRWRKETFLARVIIGSSRIFSRKGATKFREKEKPRGHAFLPPLASPHLASPVQGEVACRRQDGRVVKFGHAAERCDFPCGVIGSSKGFPLGGSCPEGTDEGERTGIVSLRDPSFVIPSDARNPLARNGL